MMERGDATLTLILAKYKKVANQKFKFYIFKFNIRVQVEIHHGQK